MIYKFTSKASGDVIMLGPQGDELMRLLGRAPAARGIIEVANMRAALQTLEATVAGDGAGAAADRSASPRTEDPAQEAPVALRQRLWPVLDMLRRCLAANQPVVWGV